MFGTFVADDDVITLGGAWTAGPVRERVPARPDSRRARPKMSKSRGNGIDPLDWVELFGADALRFTLARGASPAVTCRSARTTPERRGTLRHQDLQRHPVRVDERRPGAATRRRHADRRRPLDPGTAGRGSCRGGFGLDGYEFNRACESLYHFAWDEFCDWYLRVGEGCNSPRGFAAPRRSSPRCSTPAQVAASGDAVRHRNPVEGAHRWRIGGHRRLAGLRDGAGSCCRAAVADLQKAGHRDPPLPAATRAWPTGEGARPTHRSRAGGLADHRFPR